jgi:hypothetical protein
VAAGLRCAVPGELDVVVRVVNRDRPGEIGDKRDAGLQRSDQQRLERRVIGRDLRAELADAARDLVGVEIDLADPGVERGQLALRSP